MLRMTLGARRRIFATSEDDSSAEDLAKYGEEHAILEPWPDFLKRMAEEQTNTWKKQDPIMDCEMADKEVEMGAEAL